MHTLTLVVHDLSPLLAACRATQLTTLERFCSRGTPLRHRGLGLAAWYCQRFGVVRQRDWPVAAVLAAGAGAGPAPYWLCADPASLAVDRDRLVMLPAPVLADRESAELVECLRPHVEFDGLRMHRIDAAHWCVACPTGQDLISTEPALAVGRDIDALLISGEDASRWLRLGTELQMLLHEHPINLAREARGESPANSLWLWGGGTLPQIPACTAVVATQEALPGALARLSGARACPLPSELLAMLEAEPAGDLIVTFDAAATRPEAAAGWERKWLTPAWQSLKKQRFDRVNLVGMHGDGVVELQVERSARWKFWRRREFGLLPAGAST